MLISSVSKCSPYQGSTKQFRSDEVKKCPFLLGIFSAPMKRVTVVDFWTFEVAFEIAFSATDQVQKRGQLL